MSEYGSINKDKKLQKLIEESSLEELEKLENFLNALEGGYEAMDNFDLRMKQRKICDECAYRNFKDFISKDCWCKGKGRSKDGILIE